MVNDNLEQQARAIFSNEFLNLEVLPDGWKQASLIDIADYLNGLAMQKHRPTADEAGIPVLKIKELRQGCCDDNSELCSPNIKSEYIIHDGDVIFSWSGSLLVDFWCGGICGLNQHLFKVASIMLGQNTILTALLPLLPIKLQLWDTSSVMNFQKQRFLYPTKQTTSELELCFSQFMI